MIRVYTASKLTAAPVWDTLERVWNHVFFNARWRRHIALGTPDTPEHAVRFWVEDEQDVASADALMVWADVNDHLRGALVEVGIALANKIPVVVVGKHVDYGTWQYHPGVTRVSDFTEAYKYLCTLEK